MQSLAFGVRLDQTRPLEFEVASSNLAPLAAAELPVDIRYRVLDYVPLLSAWFVAKSTIRNLFSLSDLHIFI